jgi:hypothetical protein
MTKKEDDDDDDSDSGDQGSALLEYKVLPIAPGGRRQISFTDMMRKNETAKMIHEFDTDLDIKAFVESDSRFPYDFVRLQRSGKYRLISEMDAKEANTTFAKRHIVAGHCTLVKSEESVIMAGLVAWDVKSGRIIVYGRN